MASSEIQIDGLAELNALLETLPANIQGKVMRGALRAGQSVILAYAKQRVPVGPTSAENERMWGAYAGALRDSLKISTRLKNGVASASLTAGNKKAFYARFVEFGTKAHTIKSKTGKVLSFNGKEVPWVHHPGAKPQPFMRVAVDSQARAAVEAVAAYLGPRITKEIGKLPMESDK